MVGNLYLKGASYDELLRCDFLLLQPFFKNNNIMIYPARPENQRHSFGQLPRRRRKTPFYRRIFRDPTRCSS